MAATKIIGGGAPGSLSVIATGVEQAVDPLYQAARIALRPLDYTGEGALLGHYSVAQTSGAIAATPTALDVHASVRWAPTLANTYLVLMRIKLGWAVASTVTAAVRIAYQGSIVRGFTSDFATAATAINMATVPRTNSMRSSMGGSLGGSLLGANGPRICTTAPQTTYTGTLDSAPFALTVWDAIHSTPLTNTAAQLTVGSGGPMQTLYECTAMGQHPVVLSNNEGVAIQLIHTGWATGTISLYAMWEWAEVFVF